MHLRQPHQYLPLSPEAESFIDKITDELNARQKGSTSVVVNCWARSIQLTLVIAGILALSRADLSVASVPTITKDDCECAWDFVQWSTEGWLRLYRTKISSNEEDRNMKLISELLSRVSDFAEGGRLQHLANHGNGKGNEEICSAGWMPRSLIGRQTRIRSDDLERALMALIRNEVIEDTDIDLDGSRKAKVYRLR